MDCSIWATDLLVGCSLSVFDVCILIFSFLDGGHHSVYRQMEKAPRLPLSILEYCNETRSPKGFIHSSSHSSLICSKC